MPHLRVTIALALLLPVLALNAQHGHPSFELLTHRMDVDVDGAPNAYGPRGRKALDDLLDAHLHRRPDTKIVGYLTEPHHSRTPVVQGPDDPFPGYYISETAFSDPNCPSERDPRCYVDATRINYVVLGDAAKRRGAHLGDFVAVYSRRTHKSAFGIVGDDGNSSGDEGSLHLLQDLGYAFHDGIHDAVEHGEIVVRFYPGSNPGQLFFRSQSALNAAAARLRLSRDFRASPASKQ